MEGWRETLEYRSERGDEGSSRVVSPLHFLKSGEKPPCNLEGPDNGGVRGQPVLDTQPASHQPASGLRSPQCCHMFADPGTPTNSDYANQGTHTKIWGKEWFILNPDSWQYDACASMNNGRPTSDVNHTLMSTVISLFWTHLTHLEDTVLPALKYHEVRTICWPSGLWIFDESRDSAAAAATRWNWSLSWCWNPVTPIYVQLILLARSRDGKVHFTSLTRENLSKGLTSFADYKFF